MEWISYIFSFCLEKHSELKISLCCQSPQVNKFTRLSKRTIQDFTKEGKIARGAKLWNCGWLKRETALPSSSKKDLKKSYSCLSVRIFNLWAQRGDYVWERHAERRALKRRRAMQEEGADKERTQSGIWVTGLKKTLKNNRREILLQLFRHTV